MIMENARSAQSSRKILVGYSTGRVNIFTNTLVCNHSKLLWSQTNVFVKPFTPLWSRPRGFFAAIIARGFQTILKHAPADLILNVLWVVYIFRKGLHLSIFLLRLFYNEALLDFVI